MTHAPNPLTHLTLSDRTDLFCSPCGQYCSAERPCLCDTQIGVKPAAPEALRAKPAPKTAEPEVRFVSDGDSGSAAESHGAG